MQVTALGLLLGPVIVLISSVLAALYPMAKLQRIEPVAAMRAA
jgi:ABC-type lipoprotein release transport system permease subunit